MQKKLLIDASQQEETRIILLINQQVEEFDFESINNNTDYNSIAPNRRLSLSRYIYFNL